MRIGVLTGGGDAPGLNGVIRAVVRTAALRYNWKCSASSTALKASWEKRIPRN